MKLASLARRVARLDGRTPPPRVSERARHASALLDQLTGDEWRVFFDAAFGPGSADENPRAIFDALTPAERQAVRATPTDENADAIFAACPSLLPRCRERLDGQRRARPGLPDGSAYQPRR